MAQNTQISDNDIALDAQQGDKEAFNLLIARFTPRLRSFLYKRVKNPSDVEDIIQDTFLKAYLNIASFNPKYKFACWIFTIASRTAINNSRNRRIQATDFTVEIISQINAPDEIMEQNEQNDNLWAIAKTLETKQYSALYLKYSEDFSTEEIARTMKTTKLNVRVLLHRARNNLIKKTENVRQK